MDFFKIIFTFFLIADNISKSQSTMIIKRSSDSHSSERLRSIERALMSDNYDELKQQPQRTLEKAYSSYRSIITLPPQAETGKMLLHDPYVLQKEKEKKVAKPKKAKRTKEEILQKNRDRIGEWRIINNKEHNATRRFQYAKNAIESGRNYISKQDRIRLAKTPKRQREIICSSHVPFMKRGDNILHYLNFLERNLMDNNDNSHHISPEKLQNYMKSYQAIIDSHNESVKPKKLISENVMSTKQEQQNGQRDPNGTEAMKLTEKEKNPKKPRRNMERYNEWRKENIERINVRRRKQYQQRAFAAGRMYKPQSATNKNKQSIISSSSSSKYRTRPIGYYTQAQRRERRAQKMMKKMGMTKEQANEEAINHLRNVRLTREGKIRGKEKV